MNHVLNHKFPYHIGINSAVKSMYFMLSIYWLSIISRSHFPV